MCANYLGEENMVIIFPMLEFVPISCEEVDRRSLFWGSFSANKCVFGIIVGVVPAGDPGDEWNKLIPRGIVFQRLL
jgi:hypothetical protein